MSNSALDLMGGSQRLSASQKVWLIARRDMQTRLQSKGFVFSMLFLVLLVTVAAAAAGLLPKLLNSESTETRVAVTDTAVEQVLLDKGFDAQQLSREQAEQAVRDGDVEAAVVAHNDAGYEVIALSEAPSSVVEALTVTPQVTLLEEDSSNPLIRYLIAIGLGMVFFWSAITFCSLIAQNVVEEKANRIVEILLSTVSPRNLLVGKVLGNTVIALATIATVVLAVSATMLLTGQELLFGELGMPLLWFVPLFIVSFILTATLYSAAASLVSRQEDVASVTSPLMILIMAPFYAVLIFHSDETIMSVMSYIPFSTPVAMPLRLYTGNVEWWEPLLALVIAIVSVVLSSMIGARIYENSILRTGARIKLKDAITTK